MRRRFLAAAEWRRSDRREGRTANNNTISPTNERRLYIRTRRSTTAAAMRQFDVSSLTRTQKGYWRDCHLLIHRRHKNASRPGLPIPAHGIFIRLLFSIRLVEGGVDHQRDPTAIHAVANNCAHSHVSISAKMTRCAQVKSDTEAKAGAARRQQINGEGESDEARSEVCQRWGHGHHVRGRRRGRWRGRRHARARARSARACWVRARHSACARASPDRPQKKRRSVGLQTSAGQAMALYEVTVRSI